MKNQSQSIRNIMRSSIDEMVELPIMSINGNNYISIDNIHSYMESTGIDDEDYVIQDIKESRSLMNLAVIDEEEFKPEDFEWILEICYITEAIDAEAIMHTSKSKWKLDMMFDQVVSFILRRKYDKASELDMYIKKCDRLLKEIAEEKKIANDKTKNSAYKFQSRFVFNLLKRIVSVFVVPHFIDLHNTIKWYKFPKVVQDAVKFIKTGSTATPKPGWTTKTMTPDQYRAEVHAQHSAREKGNMLARGLDARNIMIVVSNVQALYVSLTDYEKLLDQYARYIENIKKHFKEEKKKIENKKK